MRAPFPPSGLGRAVRNGTLAPGLHFLYRITDTILTKGALLASEESNHGSDDTTRRRSRPGPGLPRIADTIVGLLVGAAGTAALAIVWGEPRPYGDPADIGSAAFFPSLVAAGLVIGGLLLIAKALLAGDAAAPATRLPLPAAIRVACGVLLIVAAVLALPRIGIWPVALLVVPAGAWLFGLRDWRWGLVLTLVPALLIISTFERILGVYFPRGGLW